MNRIAEAPAADRFIAFAMSTLRLMARETRQALATRRDGADQNPIADLISTDPRAELVDDADCFVSDDESRANWILSLDDVEIGSADGGHRNFDDRLADSRMGARDFLNAE